MNLPLSFSPISTSSSADETDRLFTESFVPSRIVTTAEGSKPGVTMNGVTIGSCALPVLDHASNYEVDCGEFDNSDEVHGGDYLRTERGTLSYTRRETSDATANSSVWISAT